MFAALDSNTLSLPVTLFRVCLYSSVRRARPWYGRGRGCNSHYRLMTDANTGTNDDTDEEKSFEEVVQEVLEENEEAYRTMGEI